MPDRNLITYHNLKVGDIIHQDYNYGEWYYKILEIGRDDTGREVLKYHSERTLEELEEGNTMYTDIIHQQGWDNWVLVYPEYKFTLVHTFNREPDWKI